MKTRGERMSDDGMPVIVAGGGPVGLITALGLVHYGIDVVVFEEDDQLSLDTKAGTILTRTVEVLDRYGAAEDVLAASLRIDEIGDIDRATGTARASVHTGELADDTRFPFVLNIPQHHLEPVLRDRLEQLTPGTVHMGHRVTGFVQRYMLVDLEVDLDHANPRDYPYLAYFGDPKEWMVLVRQPHCWRFLYPLEPGQPEPDRAELAAKAQRFIGDVDGLRVLGTNVYPVHHRVADRWRDGRVFLMGDAAHLITPMWALGLNTGVLDASNLPWRLAWVLPIPGEQMGRAHGLRPA